MTFGSRRKASAWLVALCAVAGFGCTDTTTSNQVITGRVSTTGAIAVRAVAGGEVITAAQVRSDGSFTLALPAGKRYRLEVLTATGVRNVLSRDGVTFKDLAFAVCEPGNPWDVGGIGDPNGMGGGGPGGPGNCMDPSDPNCKPPPEPCDPMTGNCDPCGADGSGCPPPCDVATDPTCEPPKPPWPCEPGDPMCEPPPPPCDPNTMDAAGNCQPPGPPDPQPEPCTDPTGANCMPTCDDPTDPNCKPPSPCGPDGMCPPSTCTDGTDPSCPPPPPPCDDPMDPTSCKDPCMDPGSCGCATNEPNCWPAPDGPTCDANGMCEPGDGMTPEFPPGDFGCMDAGL